MKMLPLLVLALLGFAFAGRAENPPAKDADAPHDFKGKYVVISMLNKTNQTWHGLVVEKASVRKVGDRWFVTGTACDIGGDSELRAGSTLWYPLADALQIEEFNSLDKIKEIMQSYRRR